MVFHTPKKICISCILITMASTLKEHFKKSISTQAILPSMFVPSPARPSEPRPTHTHSFNPVTPT